MPNKHAALKQIRKDRVRQARNQAIRSELKTMTKRLHELLDHRKLEEAAAFLPDLASHYDRAASAGVIHRNTAARSKSRLTGRLARSRQRA
jgi:small subunit ribosomal protein S20